MCWPTPRRIFRAAAVVTAVGAAFWSAGRAGSTMVEGFVIVPSRPPALSSKATISTDKVTPRVVSIVGLAMGNSYDDWRSDGVVLLLSADRSTTTMHLCFENVQHCLDEFMDSEYGQQMFGRHALASSHGITGALSLVEVAGPEVVLQLEGAFWHRRETVLGRAAVWLHACMPEIAHVTVADREQLQDFEDIVDEWTGEVLYTHDKRAPDFNGDRETMEYQGIDPDVRGPFPQGAMRSGGSMINPI